MTSAPPRPTAQTIPSFCRNCTAYCPIVVTVENGRAVKVTGDFEAPAYEGYTCPKGRDLPAQHNHPERLLRCLAKGAGGDFAPIPSAQLLDEVAAKIRGVLERHGPSAVGVFYGTGNVTNPAGSAMARAWAGALGIECFFSAMAIDKPAANISIALHGHWHAGAQSFESSDTWMIVGANPVIAKSNGAPMNNPAQRLKDAAERGMKLIVIDPRRTETARRAHVHLAVKPGEDPTLLAGIVHLIIAEGLYDRAFLAENAEGFDALQAAVAPYTPEYVSARADVPIERLREAARAFGGAKRGGVVCSTGPSFATRSNLTFYLGLVLNTLCGRWARAGDWAPYPNVLLPAFQPRAEPYAPYSMWGKAHVRGLRESAAGMPTAKLAEDILAGGIKTLICLGGNPVLSWPDQAKTIAAMRALETLVVIDTRLTATAKLAHYVVAAPLSLETAGSTSRVEALKYVGATRGFAIPWAQYTAKVVDPPPGADLIEDASFFFRLAQRMGQQLKWTNTNGYRGHVESAPYTHSFDMSREPTNEELIELTCHNSRVPLAEVKKYPHGHVFETARVRVAPRDPACTARLQLGDPLMMRELADVRSESPRARAAGRTHLLISRRANEVMNSVGQHLLDGADADALAPAFVHPSAFAALGVAPEAAVTVRSDTGEIRVRLSADESLRAGVVSIVHGFDGDGEGRSASVTRLVGVDEPDPVTGIPRMSAIPVTIEPVLER